MYKQAQEFNLLHFITCVIPSNNQAVEVPQAYPTHSSKDEQIRIVNVRGIGYKLVVQE